MKKIKVDVLIIIEHKVRELESACLLKYQFEKKGYSVKIDSIYPNKEILPLKYIAKIIFIPWAYNDKDMSYIKCFLKHSPNAKIINLHHEQYSGQDDKNICLPLGESVELYHISWGKKFTNGLKKSGVLDNRVFTVGNIKLDFYKNELRNIHLKRSELSSKYNIPIKKKWALFIANGYHLMSKSKIESISHSDSEINIKKDTAIKCRIDFLEYVDRYLSDNLNTVFIYRPHPVYADIDKQEKEIVKLRKKYPNNFFIISDLTISNWLVNSDICISFHSTSAAETCMCSKPYYLFRTKKLDYKLDYVFFNNYKYVISDYDDFSNALSNNNYDNNILKSALEDYFKIDSNYTFEKIVDSAIECDNLVIKKYTRKMWLINLIRAYIKRIMILLSKIKIFKILMKKLNDTRIDRIIEKNDDSFTLDEVDKIIKQIQEILK